MGDGWKKTAPRTRERLENWIIISLLQIAPVLEHFKAVGIFKSSCLCVARASTCALSVFSRVHDEMQGRYTRTEGNGHECVMGFLPK